MHRQEQQQLHCRAEVREKSEHIQKCNLRSLWITTTKAAQPLLLVMGRVKIPLSWITHRKIEFYPILFFIFQFSHRTHYIVPRRIRAIVASTSNSSRKMSFFSYTMRSTSTQSARHRRRVSAVPRTSHSPTPSHPSCAAIFVPSFCLVSKQWWSFFVFFLLIFRCCVFPTAQLAQLSYAYSTNNLYIFVSLQLSPNEFIGIWIIKKWRACLTARQVDFE